MSDNKPFHKRKFPSSFMPQHKEELKSEARELNLISARYNFHESDESLLHKMLIYMTIDQPDRIHKHNDKDEIIIIEEGTLIVKYYNSDLEETSRTVLNKSHSSSILIPKGQRHAICVESKEVLFMEIAQGPFQPQSTDWFTIE